jgi:hypothetical protein
MMRAYEVHSANFRSREMARAMLFDVWGAITQPSS